MYFPITAAVLALNGSGRISRAMLSQREECLVTSTTRRAKVSSRGELALNTIQGSGCLKAHIGDTWGFLRHKSHLVRRLPCCEGLATDFQGLFRHTNADLAPAVLETSWHHHSIVIQRGQRSF